MATRYVPVVDIRRLLVNLADVNAGAGLESSPRYASHHTHGLWETKRVCQAPGVSRNEVVILITGMVREKSGCSLASAVGPLNIVEPGPEVIRRQRSRVTPGAA